MNYKTLFSFIIVGLFVYVVSPLLLPVAIGAVFAVLVHPWIEKMEKRKIPAGAGAAILTVGVTIGVFVPAAIMVFLAAKTALVQLKALGVAQSSQAAAQGTTFIERLVNSSGVQTLLEYLKSWFPIEVGELVVAMQDLAGSIGLKLADAMGQFVTRLPSITMALAIVVVSLFFFLLDGRKLVEFMRRHSPFTKLQTNRLIDAFGVMCRSVLLAVMVSGFVQATVFSMACLATGVGGVALIAFMIFLASFVPLVGSAPLTFGISIIHLMNGHMAGGIVLIIVSVIVTALDYLVRPWVLKDTGKLHPLLAFLSVFGGLQILGVSGVFLGPIIAGLFIVTIRILLERQPSGIPIPASTK